MVHGLSEGGKASYRQWVYAADQLADLLGIYHGIAGSLNSKTALERAIVEVNEELRNE